MQNLTQKMESFYKKEMVEEYLGINTFIHSLVWDASGNKYLKTTLDTMQNQMLRYQKERLSFYSKPGILYESMKYHKKILKAFLTSDSTNIEGIVRSHWNISGIISGKV